MLSVHVAVRFYDAVLDLRGMRVSSGRHYYVCGDVAVDDLSIGVPQSEVGAFPADSGRTIARSGGVSRPSRGRR